MGLLDALRPDHKTPVGTLQRQDLQALGRLLVAVACQSLGAGEPGHVARSMAYVNASFSPELCQLILLLLSSPASTGHPSVHDMTLRRQSRIWYSLPPPGFSSFGERHW